MSTVAPERGKMKPQNKRILAYLEEHGEITPLEARTKLGCDRLSARIFELKAEGYPITSRTVAVKNRYDETCHIRAYRLEHEQ